MSSKTHLEHIAALAQLKGRGGPEDWANSIGGSIIGVFKDADALGVGSDKLFDAWMASNEERPTPGGLRELLGMLDEQQRRSERRPQGCGSCEDGVRLIEALHRKNGRLVIMRTAAACSCVAGQTWADELRNPTAEPGQRTKPDPVKISDCTSIPEKYARGPQATLESTSDGLITYVILDLRDPTSGLPAWVTEALKGQAARVQQEAHGGQAGLS